MNKILIDSDILLDFLLQRHPFYENSLKILRLCESKKINGFVTALIIANTYYLLRKHFQHSMIMGDFKMLMIFLDVAVMDKNTILQAINSNFSDFEDALQNFSAEHTSNINTIITRNIKDYKKSNLNVLTPEMFLSSI